MNDMVGAAKARIQELEKELRALNDFVSSAERASVILKGAGRPVAASRLDGVGRTEASPPKKTAAAPSKKAVAPRAKAVKPPSKEAVAAPSKKTEATPVKARFKKGTNPSAAVVIPAAIKALKDQGRPLSRRELHGALAARGMLIQGTDPIKALGTILWRARDQIHYVEDKGYWPVGVNPPVAA